jgi:hypothetical protein
MAPWPERLDGWWTGNYPTATQTERDAMQVLKSQTFRVVMLLSALASSSLVLMAGRRWGP